MAENHFVPKELRLEYFSKYFPYDDELARIVDIKQKDESKKKEENHDFLKKPMWQNMHIYLVEYVLAFSKKWFNKNNFTIIRLGVWKVSGIIPLKKKKRRCTELRYRNSRTRRFCLRAVYADSRIRKDKCCAVKT